jgi:hypothetical protein
MRFVCKKIGFLFVICLSVCQVASAGNWNGSGGYSFNGQKITEDVFSGGEIRPKGINHKEKYGFEIVTAEEGHPVRAGSQAMKFEVRDADCGKDSGWNDCKKDRGRWEFYVTPKNAKKFSGEWYYSWSFYIPTTVINFYPTKAVFGQFHSGKNPPFLFDLQNSEGVIGYYIDNQVPIDGKQKDYKQGNYHVTGKTNELVELIPTDKLKGRWHDVVVHANWTDKSEGYFRVSVNGVQKYEYTGPTHAKGSPVSFNFGIYTSFLSRYRIQQAFLNKDEKFVECAIDEGLSRIDANFYSDGSRDVKHKHRIKLFNSKCYDLIKDNPFPNRIIYFDEVRVSKDPIGSPE